MILFCQSIPLQAQQGIAANDVPVGSDWTVLITAIGPVDGATGDFAFTYLAGTDLRVAAHVSARVETGDADVEDAVVIFTLGNERVQAETDAEGRAVAYFRAGPGAGLFPLMATTVSGTVTASAEESIRVYDYVVEMPDVIEVESSGARSGFLDATLRRREPDDAGRLQLVSLETGLGSDLDAVRFIGDPELELTGDRNRSTETRIYETVPGADGRMEVRVRSEWEGRYLIRAVGVGGRYSLNDESLGQTQVIVSDPAEEVSLRFAPGMEPYSTGIDRIEVETEDGAPFEIEVVALVGGVPTPGVGVTAEPGAGIVVNATELTSDGDEGRVLILARASEPGPQELTISAGSSNTLVVMLVGADEEDGDCPESMLEVAERQGGIDWCGTGRPDPTRPAYALDGIWDLQPGMTEDQAAILFIRTYQSPEFAAAGRRMSEVMMSFLGDPVNPPWPRRVGWVPAGEAAIEISAGNGPTWNLAAGDDPTALAGDWSVAGEDHPSAAVLRHALPDITEITIEYAPPGALFAVQRQLVDRYAPEDDRIGQLRVVASEAPNCSGPFVSNWITLDGDGFAGGHEVWIDPASFLEISPASGWLCEDGSVAAIDGGLGEGWPNCSLMSGGDPASAVTGISVGLCPRPGVTAGPVDLWINGEALPLEISVYDAPEDIPAFDPADEPPEPQEAEEEVTDGGEPVEPVIPEEAEPEEAEFAAVRLAASPPLTFTGRATDPVEIATNESLVFEGRAVDPVTITANQTLAFEGRAADPVAIATNEVLVFQGRAVDPVVLGADGVLVFAGRYTEPVVIAADQVLIFVGRHGERLDKSIGAGGAMPASPNDTYQDGG